MLDGIQPGWSSDYYELPENARELQDLIEYRGMNFTVGNIFKAAYRLGSKDGVGCEYDLNKIIWFANRELLRLSKEKESEFENNDRSENPGGSDHTAAETKRYCLYCRTDCSTDKLCECCTDGADPDARSYSHSPLADSRW
jgi:hypothetical protein